MFQTQLRLSMDMAIAYNHRSSHSAKLVAASRMNSLIPLRGVTDIAGSDRQDVLEFVTAFANGGLQRRKAVDNHAKWQVEVYDFANVRDHLREIGQRLGYADNILMTSYHRLWTAKNKRDCVAFDRVSTGSTALVVIGPEKAGIGAILTLLRRCRVAAEKGATVIFVDSRVWTRPPWEYPINREMEPYIDSVIRVEANSSKWPNLLRVTKLRNGEPTAMSIHVANDSSKTFKPLGLIAKNRSDRLPITRAFRRVKIVEQRNGRQYMQSQIVVERRSKSRK